MNLLKSTQTNSDTSGFYKIQWLSFFRQNLNKVLIHIGPGVAIYHGISGAA